MVDATLTPSALRLQAERQERDVEGLMTSEQENIKRIKDRDNRIKQLNKIFRKEVSSND